jgi:hypothetical protein
MYLTSAVKKIKHHSPIVSCEFLTAVKILIDVFWVMALYCFVRTDHEMIRWSGVSGAVRGSGGYRQDNWTAIGRSDRLFYC